MVKLLKSTAKVGAATIISRVLGFVRDMVFARYFGASAATDAFFLAFKIPNFMRRLFAEGAFSQAFVPVFSEYKEKHSREALRDLVNHVAGSLGTVLLVIADLGTMEAWVEVDETEVVDVELGQPAQITIDAFPDRKLSGSVRSISATAAPMPSR